MSTSRAIWKFALVVAVAVGVYGWGPSLLAPLQEGALANCARNFGDGSAGIEWQGLPERPGWICTTASGTRNIGWWGWWG